MTVKTPSIILNYDCGRSLNKPSFDIIFSGPIETKRSCNMFSLLHYFELTPSRADENVMSNRSAKIGDKVRFWLAHRVKGHIFVCYLAYLLLSVLEYKLRKTGIKATEAIETMESMYRVYITDPKSKNKFIKTVTLSKKQEDILRELNPSLLTKCSV